MKKITKRFFGVLLGMVITISIVLPQHVAFSAELTEDNISLVPGANNAYVVFGDTIAQNHMTYFDGMAKGIKDPSDPLYSEAFEMDGVKGRKVYNANYTYLKVDEDYYEPGDSRFMVTITFYDFGPNIGYYYLEYNSKSSDYQSYRITKPGITPKWTTVRIFLNDVEFKSSMDYGADMRIKNGAYNAFAKVELVNLDALERTGGGDDIELPSVAGAYAECLDILGLYDATDEDGKSYPLDGRMTRSEAVKRFIQVTGNKREVEDATPCSKFNDVKDQETLKALTVAEQLGIITIPQNGKFRPDDYVTPRELATMWLRYMHYEPQNGKDLYSEAINMAIDNFLITEQDFIIFYEQGAIRDHFVSMAYNALLQQDNITNNILIGELYNKGIVTKQQVEATGVPKFMACLYMNPTKLPKAKKVDPITGETYWYVNFFGMSAIRPYVSCQQFNYDGTKFIFANENTMALYEYDIENETVRFLDFVTSISDVANAHVSSNDVIYYNKNSQTWKIDWKTYKRQFVVSRSFGNMTVSNDEKWISGDTSHGMITKYNTETGQVDEMSVIKYPSDQQGINKIVNHVQVNPAYPNLIFFASEGTTTKIPDRIWVADFDTKDVYNFFIQADAKETTADLRTGETVGHEVWSMDGEMLYWVKYTYASNVGQSGLMRASKDSKDGLEREYINGEYSYWHCYPSSDHNWVVGDTQSGQIVLCDTRTQKATLYAKVAFKYDPHPNMNYGNTMISWQMVDDKGINGVGFADVTKYTQDLVVNGGKMEINENISYVSYSGAKSEVKIKNYQGVNNAYYIGKKNVMYCDINDEVAAQKGNSIKLSVTFLDVGDVPIKIGYTSKITDNGDLANMYDSYVAINKKGTNTWKTEIVEINDAELKNNGNLNTDISISSGPVSVAVIKDIKIVE